MKPNSAPAGHPLYLHLLPLRQRGLPMLIYISGTRIQVVQLLDVHVSAPPAANEALA